MNAIILCAGNARRFFADGESQPKCLLPLTEDETILARLLRQLRARHRAVILGTGCGHEHVAQAAMRAMHPALNDAALANGAGENSSAHNQEREEREEREERDVDGSATVENVSGESAGGEDANGANVSDSAPPVRCVFNREYKTTNSIVTLWQARDFITDATLIINGDLVVDDGVFDLFDDAPSPQLLVKRLPQFDDDTYRVVFNAGGRVTQMGKEIDATPSPFCAAFVGVSRIGCADSFLREIRALLDSGDNQTWPTTAYKGMMAATPATAVRVCDIGDSMFHDIDTPAEYEAARHALARAH